jgi:soluble lytic murein transglycosylase
MHQTAVIIPAFSGKRCGRLPGLNLTDGSTGRLYPSYESLVKAVIKAESDFDPGAVSRKGAQGLMQLMPDTARDMAVNNPFHPTQNMEGGIRYLRKLLDQFQGNLHLALAAYNAGENAVIKYNNSIPPFEETRTYVKRVLKFFGDFQAAR